MADGRSTRSPGMSPLYWHLSLIHIYGAMQVAMEGSEIVVTRPSENKEHKSLHGLTRTLISNMVEGVTTGFKKELEINGVGYRAAKQGKDLVMNLGYSHQVIVSELSLIHI